GVGLRGHSEAVFPGSPHVPSPGSVTGNRLPIRRSRNLGHLRKKRGARPLFSHSSTLASGLYFRAKVPKSWLKTGLKITPSKLIRSEVNVLSSRFPYGAH